MGIVTTATDKMQPCIDACQKRAQACYECFNSCLQPTFRKLNYPKIKFN
ncbi:hypothetical protein SOV_32990 [Sporomusa ovata DSM 2662]|nr:hypothetical protein SOV_5c04030 [Sporomusa ovata DSM 2662]